MGRIVARGVIGRKNCPIKSMWDKPGGCPLVNCAMLENFGNHDVSQV